MPFYIKQGDITKLQVDAIVNAANSSLLGGGGVDGAIHRAAGPELREYCAGLGGCETGEAKLSPGFRLPAKWIIHTVGPIWRGGGRNEEALLASCYRNSLALALEAGCESVAFPLISAGAYGYPKDQALAVAVREIKLFLENQELEVTLMIYSPSDFVLPERLYIGVQSFLRRYRYEEWTEAPQYTVLASAPMSGSAPNTSAAKADAAPKPSSRRQQKKISFSTRPFRKKKDSEANYCAAAAAPAPEEVVCEKAESLDQYLRCLDESFSQMLLRKIDEKGMTDAACYKRANVDRKLFSKIRSDPNYRPSKPTAIAFAIALELPLPEARELLMKAGFALSHSNKFDIIIEYFIANGNYNIFEINEALFAFDQTLLGA